MTFIDTADVYGGGDIEQLISALLADRRGEVTLATKFGVTGDPRIAMPAGWQPAARRPTCGSAST